jgi:hypothetical protein
VNRRFDIIRGFLQRTATPQPNASNGDSTLTGVTRRQANSAARTAARGRIPATAAKSTAGQIVLILLGTIDFLYFARPVVLPIVLACVAGMALKPLIRWLSCCHIPPALSSAVVLRLLVSSVAIGFHQLGRPALVWLNEAPNT